MANIDGNCFARISLALVLLLATFDLISGDPMCEFPELLTSVGSWDTKVLEAGSEVGTFVTFAGQDMEELSYGPLGELEIIRHCIRSYDDSKFLFSGAQTASDVQMYQCFQFTIHSTNVIQVRSSGVVTTELESQTLCEDSNLHDIPWPLVSKHVRLENYDSLYPRTCGFQGGYDFRLFVNEHSFESCSSDWLKSRIEANCEQETSILIDFRSFYCQSSLEMAVAQELMCLGSWIYGNYTFTIVSNGATFWPKIWLLRFPVVMPEETFDIILSPSLFADTSPDFDQVKKHFKMLSLQSDYPSTCEDEAYICDNCDPLLGADMYCQRSCSMCDSSMEDGVFDAQVRGDWKEVTGFKTSYITIANSMIYADGSLPLQNLDLPGRQNLKNRYTVATLYKNGCKPRYQCVEVVSQGENVIQFRSGNMLKWPYKQNISTQDICNDGVFTENDADFMDSSQEKHFRLLVRSISQSREMSTVECGFHGEFSFIAKQNTKDDIIHCSGKIRSCDFRDVFHVTYSDQCSQHSNIMETYHCVGAFQTASVSFMITEAERNPDELNCWIVYKFPDDSVTTIYKMQPSDCNAAIPDHLRYENGTTHLAEFLVDGDSQLMDESSCQPNIDIPHTTEGAVVTTDSATMSQATSRPLVTQNIPPDRSTSERPYIFSTEPQQEPELGAVGSDRSHSHHTGSLLTCLLIGVFAKTCL